MQHPEDHDRHFLNTCMMLHSQHCNTGVGADSDLWCVQEVVDEWQGSPATVLEEVLHAMWARLPDLSWACPSGRPSSAKPEDVSVAADEAVSRYSCCLTFV